MDYFILQPDPRIVEQPTVLGYPNGFEPEEWLDGKLMDGPPNPARFTLSPRSTNYRGCIIEGVATLFHDVFRAELMRLGIDNIQYFPIELENPRGEIETKYSIVNVLGIIEGVDKQRSAIEPMIGGKGRGRLRSFRIDESAVRGLRLFRIVENPTLIIIDQPLREALVAFNPPGVWMLPTDRYEGY